MHVLKSFVRWWNSHGGNSHMSDLEAAYQAGWAAALRHRRPLRR
jgi:hypothetical protein